LKQKADVLIELNQIKGFASGGITEGNVIKPERRTHLLKRRFQD